MFNNNKFPIKNFFNLNKKENALKSPIKVVKVQFNNAY